MTKFWLKSLPTLNALACHGIISLEVSLVMVPWSSYDQLRACATSPFTLSQELIWNLHRFRRHSLFRQLWPLRTRYGKCMPRRQTAPIHPDDHAGHDWWRPWLKTAKLEKLQMMNIYKVPLHLSEHFKGFAFPFPSYKGLHFPGSKLPRASLFRFQATIRATLHRSRSAITRLARSSTLNQGSFYRPMFRV